MADKLHVTLAQTNPIVGDLDYNFQKISKVWSSAPANTDLIVFPEMVVCGYPPEDLVLKPSFMSAIEKSVEKILTVSKTQKSAAIVPTPWVLDGYTYNAMLLIENGEIRATILKHHLPNYGVFDERRVFIAGPLPEPVQFRGFSLGLLLCEDMWFSDVANHLASKGAEILIVPNASPYEIEKEKTRHVLAALRVKETKLPLLYVNQVGGQDELTFDGGSFVLHENGNIILEGAQFTEETYNIVFEKNKSGLIFAPVQETARNYSQLEEIYHALKLGLRDYVHKNRFPGVLIGLSGGIDSALSAVIAVDALGPDGVHGVMMPSEFTSRDSMRDAENLAWGLGIQIETISIEKPMEAFHEVLTGHIKGAPGTTFENLQPRARGVILMAMSNAHNKLVLSTGNKSEMAVGYATLYGDMCGGFNVLKDVYKTQVYELANWRNANKPYGSFGPEKNVIPEHTITRAPTAELRPNQTDQDSLPPYDVLDAILLNLIENDLSVEDIVEMGHKRETILKVWRMLDTAEYKRRQATPGVKITRRAFGRDRRYPITNNFSRILK